MHISVLIPAYNHENYITGLLSSLKADNEVIGEIIIIDDASTDNTYGVVKEFIGDDDKTTIIRNTKNVGLSTNLNRLINLAQFNYIALIASDDLSIPGSLIKKMMFLERASSCDVVFTDCEVITKNGLDYCKSGLTNLYDMDLRALNSGSDKLHHELIFNWGVPGSTLLIKREFFDAFHFKKWCNLDDLDLFLHAINTKRICYFDIKSTRYRIHSGSAKNSVIRRIKMKMSFVRLLLYYLIVGKPHLKRLIARFLIKKVLT